MRFTSTLTLLTTLLTCSQAQISSSYVSPSPFHASSILLTVNVAGVLTRTTTSYTLKYEPSSSSSGREGELSHWTIGIAGQPGFVEAKVGKGSDKKVTVVQEVASSTGESDLTFYSITIPPPSNGETTTVVTLETISSHQVKPADASLSQTADGIKMRWSSDLSRLLAGLTPNEVTSLESIKIKLVCPNPRISDVVSPDSFESNHPQGSATVTFSSKGGISDNLSPNSGSQLASVDYMLPEAAASMRSLDRIVEVSHWGSKLSIQDNVDLFNPGPKLEGYFSRLEHQRRLMQNRQKVTAVTDLKIELPSGAFSPYYYDVVGNVSTSHFRPSPKLTSAQITKKKSAAPAILELKPRYPLQGGWNYSFTYGYDLPLGDAVKVRKGAAGGRSFLLSVPFLTPLKDVAVDQARFEVRLPQGASNIRVTAPFSVDSIDSSTLTKTYLDSTGRPTIILTKKNCSDRHGKPVLIEYDLSLAKDLFWKPVSVATVLAGVFAVVALGRRWSWTIPK